MYKNYYLAQAIILLSWFTEYFKYLERGKIKNVDKIPEKEPKRRFLNKIKKKI